MKIHLGDVILDTQKLIENLDNKSDNDIKFYLNELVAKNEELSKVIKVLYDKLNQSN